MARGGPLVISLLRQDLWFATVSRRARSRHAHPVAIYLAESYLSRERASDMETLAHRLQGTILVRHLFSYFVADDETAVHCLQGPSPDAVREALERVGITADRIVGAEPFGAGPAGATARRSIEPRPDP